MKFTNSIKLITAQDVKYLHNNLTGELIEVKYVETFIGLDGFVEYRFTHAGKELNINQYNKEWKMYNSLDKFERNVPEEASQYNISNHILYRGHFLTEEADEGLCEATSYHFVNGVPVTVDAPIKGFVMKNFPYTEPVYDEKVDKNDYFQSMQHAIAFHPYDLQNDEGKVVSQEGRFEYLMPDEKQQKIIDKLRKTMEEAKAAGVGIFFDISDNTLTAFNNNTASVEYGEGGFQFQFPLPEKLNLLRIDYYNNDDDYGIVKK